MAPFSGTGAKPLLGGVAPPSTVPLPTRAHCISAGPVDHSVVGKGPEAELIKNFTQTGHQWLTPVILVTQEAEIGRILV
jgi:hypothetical protein